MQIHTPTPTDTENKLDRIRCSFEVHVSSCMFVILEPSFLHSRYYRDLHMMFFSSGLKQNRFLLKQTHTLTPNLYHLHFFFVINFWKILKIIYQHFFLCRSSHSFLNYVHEAEEEVPFTEDITESILSPVFFSFLIAI